jgi:hypothetical protein
MTARVIGSSVAALLGTTPPSKGRRPNGAGRNNPERPIHRESYNVGERELYLWQPIDPTEINPRIKAAQLYDRRKKLPGRRNGALGHIAIEILEALYSFADYATGRLEPTLDQICRRINRSRPAVVDALKRLKQADFVNWIRRCEPTGKETGQQVKQAPNAYVLGLPREMLAYVAKKLRRKPKDAVPAEQRIAQARAAYLKNRPPTVLPQAVREALAKRAADRTGASSLGELLSAPKGEK